MSIDISRLPSRIFAAGDEPVGDRVNSYFKLSSIGTVLKYLQPSEIEQIRPVFGTLLDAYHKPAYSGKLAHFRLTRQLVVNKDHEIWVVFSGRPIKFSLREFSLVTGLNCDPLPVVPAERVKSPPGVAPYWYTLFGGEPFVTGEMLRSMLKRSKDLSSDVRVKYACLLLVDGVLCRRSSPMKIPAEHVEMIRDLDYFLSYPWGRFCFDMTVRCIRTRQTNQLAQPTVAIQGFIHALQLVFLEAVPSAVAAVGDGTDVESGEDDATVVTALKLDKIWELDEDKTVLVNSIIRASDEPAGGDCSWSDELEDPKVEYMTDQIGEGAMFNKIHFTGGRARVPNTAPLVPPTAPSGKRKEKTAHVSETRLKIAERGKRTLNQNKDESTKKGDSTINMEMVAGHVKEALSGIEKSIMDSLQSGLKQVEVRLLSGIDAAIKEKVDEHLNSKESDATIGRVLRDIANDKEKSGMNQATNEVPHEATSENVSANPGLFSNKKFISIVENPIPTRTLEFTPGIELNDRDLVTIPLLIPSDSSMVIDSCVMLLRENLFTQTVAVPELRADIMPSAFSSMLAKHHGRFKKVNKKESFEFDADLLEYVRHRMEESGKEWVKDLDVIYFPINFNKNRWVAVVVDLPSASVTVFDSHAKAVHGSRLKPEFDFICEMLPFLIRKAASCEAMESFKLSTFSFSRDLQVAQVDDRRQTGIMSVMFIESHATGGLASVYSVAEDMIRAQAENLVVEMFELCCGDVDESV